MLSSSASAASAGTAASLCRSRSLGQDMLRRLSRDPLVVVCVLYLLLLIIVAIFPAFFATAPMTRPPSPTSLPRPARWWRRASWRGTRIHGGGQAGPRRLQPPCLRHAVSMSVAFLGVLISFLIGVSYGLFSGYSRPVLTTS